MSIRVVMLADLPREPGRIDGGVQAVTSYLVQGLAAFDDIELHIVAFGSERQESGIRTADGHYLYRFPFARLGTLTGFRRDQKCLDDLVERVGADLVHSQGGGFHGILASRSPVPAVVTIHGILRQEADLLGSRRRRLRTRAQAWLGERHYVRKAQHTIVISPYISKYYGSALKGQSYFIPNPVAPCFFDLRRRPEAGRVLFAGRLYALKGVKDLVAAAGSLRAAGLKELVLAGSTSDSGYVDELRKEAERNDIAAKVSFRGILPTEELLEELARCTCLVLPSYQESAPMVIQEAMAAGVPVIATDVGGIRYQVEDGVSGFLVRPGDPMGLARTLERVLGDRSLANAVSAAARERAEETFRASEVARMTTDVYKSIVGETKCPSKR